MTVADYKVPFAGTSDVKYDERFNDGQTSYAAAQYTVTAGSPATAVTNPDTRMMITGTSGSTVNKVITLTTGHKYFVGFDYQSGNTAIANYSLTNLNVSGALQTDGHTEMIVDIGAGTNINLAFSCQDAASGRFFYIDNILIKDLGTTLSVLTNTVLNEDFSGSSYPWVASNSSISYVSGKMHVTGTSGTAPYNVAHGMGLLPGQAYRIRLDVGSPSLAGGNLSFGFDSNDGTSGQDFAQTIGTSAGTYTFFVIPKTVENTFYINLNSPSGGFSFDIDNFIIELVQGNPKPLYTAVANDITDYYAFGAPMPGRLYHLSVPNAYRYGFNGQEKDNEVYGDGNLNSAEYWEYDTRLGRRWNTDPIIKPWESPYACFGDNPIWYNDVKGLNKEKGDKGKKKKDDEGELPTVTGNNKEGYGYSDIPVFADRPKLGFWQRVENIAKNVGHEIKQDVMDILHVLDLVVHGKFHLWGQGMGEEGMRYQKNVNKMKHKDVEGIVFIDFSEVWDALNPLATNPLGGEGDEARKRSNEIAQDQYKEPEKTPEGLNFQNGKAALQKATGDTVVTRVLTGTADSVKVTYDKQEFKEKGDGAGMKNAQTKKKEK